MKKQAKKLGFRSILILLMVIFNFSLSNGNTSLHERTLTIDESISTTNEKGKTQHVVPDNLTTWIFKDGTYIPMAKLQDFKSYSNITNHHGTLAESYENGKKELRLELYTLKES